MGKSKELAELGQVVSQSGGNVGIGTDEPAWPISVQKSAITGWQYYAQEGITSFGAGIGSDAVYNTNYFGPNTAGVQVDNTTETQELRFVNRSPSGTVTFRTGASNPVERMKIDGSGRVTMPYQPAFSAFRNTSASTIYSSGTIIYPNYRFNVGNHYNLSTGVFTAPVDGRYQFNAHFMLHTTYANASNMYWGIVVNGVNYALINYGAASQDGGQTIASTIQLSAGDSAYVSLVSGSSIQTYGKEYHGFSGYLIG